MENNQPLAREILRLCETLFDITQVASTMALEGKIIAEDSRDLFGTCLALAQQFESENPKIEGDYMLRIEEFATKQLTEHYERTKL